MIRLNGVTIPITMFPDKTSQVWKLNMDLLKYIEVIVDWEFEHEGEIVHLAQLKDLLDSHARLSSLKISYLPYARQDKAVTNNSTFALHSFTKLLNVLNFRTIEIVDVHSDVATSLITNSYNYIPHKVIKNIYTITTSNIICYPDFGARHRYLEEHSYGNCLLDINSCFGKKVRDQSTGEIVNYTVDGEVKHKKVLIVDDICDGGATFILLTKELLTAGAKEVNLYVTHGIFSKGIKVLKDAGVKRIFTIKGEVF
jgi:ribose-phosphate pyrophosphokinase